jgi:hypothetical protein
LGNKRGWKCTVSHGAEEAPLGRPVGLPDWPGFHLIGDIGRKIAGQPALEEAFAQSPVFRRCIFSGVGSDVSHS